MLQELKKDDPMKICLHMAGWLWIFFTGCIGNVFNIYPFQHFFDDCFLTTTTIENHVVTNSSTTKKINHHVTIQQ
jgi:hypothetical protein